MTSIETYNDAEEQGDVVVYEKKDSTPTKDSLYIELHEAERVRDEAKVLELESKIRSQEKQEAEDTQRINYELSRMRVFAYIKPLEDKVQRLTQAVKEVEDTDESSYKERLNELRIAEQKRDTVLNFEQKLWGDSPSEHEAAVKDLFSNIRAIQSVHDVEEIFDVWGALPGASDLDRPLTNKEAVISFINKIDELDQDECLEKANALFSNETVRKTILNLRREPIVIDPPVAPLEVNMGVIDDEDTVSIGEKLERPRVYAPEIQRLRHEINIAEKARDEESVIRLENELREVEKKNTESIRIRDNEVGTLAKQESALIESRDIIKSKMFRFAPFVMKFTKEGRRKLAVLKDAGLDIKATGGSGGNLEIARALRLKAIREKGTQLLDQVNTSFVHSPDLRADAKRQPKGGKTIEQFQTEAMLDEETKNPKKRNVRKVKDSLNRLSK